MKAIVKISAFLTEDRTRSDKPVLRTASDQRTYIVVVADPQKDDNGVLIPEVPARAVFGDEAFLNTITAGTKMYVEL